MNELHVCRACGDVFGSDDELPGVCLCSASTWIILRLDNEEFMQTYAHLSVAQLERIFGVVYRRAWWAKYGKGVTAP